MYVNNSEIFISYFFYHVVVLKLSKNVCFDTIVFVSFYVGTVISFYNNLCY